MVYITGIGCPAATDFFRSVGATDIHFGLLSGLPMFMVFLQFAGAVAANRLRHRKGAFMVLTISGRLLYVPIVLVPLLMASSSQMALKVVMVLVALSSALQNLSSPLWLSWMADLVPGRILNRYWGTRQAWMAVAGVGTFLVFTALTYVLTELAAYPMTVVFPLLVALSVTAGVVDISLFTKVHEPLNTTTPDQPILEAVTEPHRHPDYRTFVLYSGMWAASVMFSAAFMQIYVLRELHVPAWEANLVWCVPGVGVALTARLWGKIADRRGQKPVLIVCTTLKPMIVLVFFLLTRESVLWMLSLAFLLDGALNAGNSVASTGYMMKIAPQKNRSMFMASITGLAGIAGGLGAVAGGVFLERLGDFSLTAFGRSWSRYHVLFGVGFLLRVACIVVLHWVKEPRSGSPVHVLQDLTGVWPLRWLRLAGTHRRGAGAPVGGNQD